MCIRDRVYTIQFILKYKKSPQLISKLKFLQEQYMVEKKCKLEIDLNPIRAVSYTHLRTDASPFPASSQKILSLLLTATIGPLRLGKYILTVGYTFTSTVPRNTPQSGI